MRKNEQQKRKAYTISRIETDSFQPVIINRGENGVIIIHFHQKEKVINDLKAQSISIISFSGCRITAVAPGTKLVSKFVKYSTTQKTNLAVGCYRVKEPKKDQERILIIRDEKDKGGGDNPVRVTDLASDNR